MSDKTGASGPNPWVHAWLIPIARGIAGAAVGAVIGYFLFGFLLSKSLYAFMVPAGMLGIGFGVASRKRSVVLGLIVAVIAMVFGLWTESRWFPFDDPSFTYFLKALASPEGPQYKYLLHLLAGVVAFWFARGR